LSPRTAVVTWRRAPVTAYRNRTVVYEVAAVPYDAGAKAYLQVRKAGSTAWTTVRTATVPTSTVTRFSYAFPVATTWAVRVVRGTRRCTTAPRRQPSRFASTEQSARPVGDRASNVPTPLATGRS